MLETPHAECDSSAILPKDPGPIALPHLRERQLEVGSLLTGEILP
jgi:hypothetical protein